MDTVYWIWLSIACGAGSESGSFLLSKFGTPEAIYALDEDEIKNVEGIDASLKSKLCDKDTSYAERVYEYCQRVNVGIMTPDSPIYPERLKRIYAKPLVLYYKGKIPVIDDNVLVACVGTRKCSEYGMQTAYKLGAELAQAGAVVVSGMALGIDAMCARGALAAGGQTIAVLGSGIDVIYPKQNAELYKEIIKHGAIITEYAPGTEPDGAHFPVRNRLISGLSLGTCVVEADERSGSLITARHAEKQGRDIFAFPGRVGESTSSGTNELIRNGAIMVRSARDILEEYELLYPHRIFTERIQNRKYFVRPQNLKVASAPPAFEDAPKRPAKPVKPAKMPKTDENDAKKVIDTSHFSETEKAVYEAIGDGATLDAIIEKASYTLQRKLGSGDVLAILTSFEIEGVCRISHGALYVPM